MGRINPLWDKFKLFDIIGYTPHIGQKEFHLHPARFKTLRCGRRAGKTTCGPIDKIHIIMTPGSRGWIVAPDYRSGEKEYRVIRDALFGGQLFPKSQIKQFIFKTVKNTNNPTQGQMHLSIIWKFDPAFKPENKHLNMSTSPSEILVISADNEGGSLGEEIDWLVMAEVGQLTDSLNYWEQYLRMSLTSRYAEAVFPSTSYGGKSELLDYMFDMGQDSRNKEYKSWQWPSYINPGWSPEPEKELAELRKMSTEAYAEQVLGERVNYAGRFYKEFNSEIHIADLKFDPYLPVYRSWDFGYRHPAIGWFQINKRDQVCWLYSYLGTNLDDIDFIWIGKYLSGQVNQLPFCVREIIKKEGLFPFIPKSETVVFEDMCDAAGTQVKSSDDSAIQCMYSQGIYPRYQAEKTQKDEREPESIGIVRNLLKIRDNGEPNLLVDKKNTLACGMFKELTFENRHDGINLKFKRDGFYEHIADDFKYFCLNKMKYSLYTDAKHAKMNREMIQYVNR